MMILCVHGTARHILLLLREGDDDDHMVHCFDQECVECLSVLNKHGWGTSQLPGTR